MRATTQSAKEFQEGRPHAAVTLGSTSKLLACPGCKSMGDVRLVEYGHEVWYRLEVDFGKVLLSDQVSTVGESSGPGDRSRLVCQKCDISFPVPEQLFYEHIL